jgi:hypothetical protein
MGDIDLEVFQYLLYGIVAGHLAAVASIIVTILREW